MEFKMTNASVGFIIVALSRASNWLICFVRCVVSRFWLLLGVIRKPSLIFASSRPKLVINITAGSLLFMSLSVAGKSSAVAITGKIFSHRHANIHQYHVWRANNPPVVNSIRSQACAARRKSDKISSTWCHYWFSLILYTCHNHTQTYLLSDARCALLRHTLSKSQDWISQGLLTLLLCIWTSLEEMVSSLGILQSSDRLLPTCSNCRTRRMSSALFAEFQKLFCV